MDAFWEVKSLPEMSETEWEALCDGCGLCCRLKLEDSRTGEVVYTSIACRLLDLETCRCADYRNRRARVPQCIRLTARNVPELPWLPSSCAYRLLSEGRDLPAWHPLMTGDPESPHREGFTVRDRVVSEDELPGWCDEA